MSRWIAAVRRWLVEDLFPAAPERAVTPLRILAVLVAVAGLVALSLARQTGVGALDTIWAEDGSTFLAQALDAPLDQTVGRAYAGYLHLLPRLAAEGAALVPVSHAAMVLALSGALVTAVSGVLAAVASAGHIRSAGARAVLATLVVAQPVSGFETLNSIAYAQWAVAFAAFWVALWRPSRPASVALASLVLAVAVLTAPLTLVLVPVLVLRVVIVPHWRDRLPAAAFAVAAGVQGWALATQPAPMLTGGTAAQLVEAYARLAVTPAVFGLRLVTDLRPTLGDAPAVVAVGLAAAALLGGVARPGARHRLTVLLAAGVSAVAYAGSLYGRGSVERLLEAAETGMRTDSSRFAVVPALLLASVVALVLDDRPTRIGEGAWRGLRGGVLAVVALVAGVDFLVVNDRSAGPAWSDEVVEAVRECRDGGTTADLQGSPPLEPFAVTVECDRLQR